MANNQNLFFYAPTWDYPPDGPIKLGNVITSVKKPERPLHCVPPTDSDVFSTKKTNVKHTRDEAQNENFSILVKFFNILGLDIQVSVGRQTSDQRIFSFKAIETKQFVPTLPYVQACVENDNVRRFLEMSRYRKPVFIITGLKIVFGDEASMMTSHFVRNSPVVQIDSTIPQIGPIKLSGSNTESGTAAKTVTEWESSDNFLFAFRVSKVLVGKATGQVISEEDYRRGAMFGDNAELREIQGPPLSILKVEHPDAEGEGYYTEELTEGDDVVTCAL
ncbi:hypothetical protein TGAMA5MH_06511 [Trichoderma gamsii]|uniref:Uncharacterized protein n=1 Tax=Trichoderma gamsii TaxID=398673 RepID=A0A2K0T7S8_9HYPO|nr:hypothetical protein TGAMA5MH_06511 [Trichoderma gamsii]